MDNILLKHLVLIVKIHTVKLNIEKLETDLEKLRSYGEEKLTNFIWAPSSGAKLVQ